MPQNESIAVIGLGYVGLPVALSLAKKYDVVGFDINVKRVEALRAGTDSTEEVTDDALKQTSAKLTSDPEDLKGVTFFVIAVPTPIDEDKRPDLRPVIGASKTVGAALSKRAVVVYESTVYPGVTEEICGPVLEQASGLKCGVDFFLGYSPERINPGDKEHTFEKIVKVVAAQDAASTERVAAVYGSVITAGIHKAPSIKVAEAAKVIENTQRDLNIALMNELALIFDRLGIRTADVLAAARTKWNFLPFTPGLVGGHCIGVDPYYLTTKAQQVGYQPEVIMAGRRINDNVGAFVAQSTLKLLSKANLPMREARVGVLGLTFKENVPDLRNSRVPDIVRELKEFGITPMVHDPHADHEEAAAEYGIELSSWDAMTDLDALIYAVSHDFYQQHGAAGLTARIREYGVLVDVKSVMPPDSVDRGIHYWSL